MARAAHQSGITSSAWPSHQTPVAAAHHCGITAPPGLSSAEVPTQTRWRLRLASATSRWRAEARAASAARHRRAPRLWRGRASRRSLTARLHGVPGPFFGRLRGLRTPGSPASLSWLRLLRSSSSSALIADRHRQPRDPALQQHTEVGSGGYNRSSTRSSPGACRCCSDAPREGRDHARQRAANGRWEPLHVRVRRGHPTSWPRRIRRCPTASYA